MGPFKIFKKISNLTYKLNLLNNIYIYSVILIAQLKFKTNINLYYKIILPPPLIEKINFNNLNLIIKYLLYKIDTLLKRRNIEVNNKYLIN